MGWSGRGSLDSIPNKSLARGSWFAYVCSTCAGGNNVAFLTVLLADGHPRVGRPHMGEHEWGNNLACQPGEVLVVPEGGWAESTLRLRSSAPCTSKDRLSIEDSTDCKARMHQAGEYMLGRRMAAGMT